jgi:multiple sugar transport system ATP-binding protein
VQIGTPEEIWRRPADTFVARALGQPEINVLDGVVEDGRIRLGDGSFGVPVPAGLNLSTGDRVRVGLRPSDINVVTDADAGSAKLSGTVILAERLGRNIELTVEVGGEQLIVLSSGRDGVTEGAPIGMTVSDDDVHVFAPGDGTDDGDGGGDGGDTHRLGADDKTMEAAQ